jgi:hypothetical protein
MAYNAGEGTIVQQHCVPCAGKNELTVLCQHQLTATQESTLLAHKMCCVADESDTWHMLPSMTYGKHVQISRALGPGLLRAV